jgi:hypothetical protein
MPFRTYRAMPVGLHIPTCSGLPLLEKEWQRLGIEMHVVSDQADDASLHLGLTTEAQAWMPDFDTLDLTATLKLAVSDNEDDLLREIWLTLLNSPLQLEFPSAEELVSSANIRRKIARNAALTCLNFHTTAVERPNDCWRYSEDTGFVLIPGSPLIESLKKACQPEPGGELYSFSCYRASEYVVLLSIAEEARDCHPELLQRLQHQWETKAIASRRFHEVFMNELGTVEQPLPMHYYVPGDRVWFRNPDEPSEDATGYEGSWVFYLGGGLFSNFWKRDQAFTVLTKCIEIYHWRESAFLDAEGEMQMDETKVEQLVAQTLADPVACAKIYELMHRMRDPLDVYAGGGCMDATRETAKFVTATHGDIIKGLDELLG